MIVLHAGAELRLTVSQVDRLLDSVDVDTAGCWPWGDRVDRWGYGTFKVNGFMTLAHRMVYQVATGQLIAPEQQVDHLCANPPCCNPAHMEIVDNRTNKIRGCHRAGTIRHLGGECRNGHILDANNAYRSPAGSLLCRACRREANRRYRGRTPGGSASLRPGPTPEHPAVGRLSDSEK